MSSESREALRLLELLSRIATRTAHALRTPLGITLGALDDLAQGYSLSADEIADACEAARRMNDSLTQLIHLTPTTFDSSELMLTAAELAAALSGAGFILSGNSVGPSSRIRGSVPLVSAAIRNLALYCTHTGAIAQPVEFVSERNRVVVTMSGKRQAQWPVGEVSIWRATEADQSFAGLALLAATLLAEAAGGTLSARPSEDNLFLQLGFSLAD